MSDTTADATETAEVDEAQASTDTQETSDTEHDGEQAQEADDADGSDWRKNFDPDKAAARIAKIQSENKNLRERAKSAEQKASETEQTVKEKVPALESEVLRLSVALDLGLPKELAERLKGSNREELLADAESLLRLVSTPRPTPRKPIEALRGGGEPEAEPADTDLRKIGERMFNR